MLGSASRTLSRLPMMAAVISLIALGAPGSCRAEITLFDCGGTVPQNQRAVLQNDVVCDFRCSGDPSVLCGYQDDETCRGIGTCEADFFRLARGAVLELNGHTIEAAYQASAVVCGFSRNDNGRCIVKGPGTIRGGKGSAIYGGHMDIIVRDVTVSRFDTSIYTLGRITAKGLVVLGDRENSVYGGEGVTLRDVTMDGESVIQSGQDMFVDNVVLGPHHGRLEAVGLVHGRDVMMLGNRSIAGRDVWLRRVTSEPSEPDDVCDVGCLVSADRSLRLVDSHVVSIESGREPVLVRSTCDFSTVAGSSASWGVCSNDP